MKSELVQMAEDGSWDIYVITVIIIVGQNARIQTGDNQTEKLGS